MAYPPRLFEENYWYHVYTRGQRQEPLFFSPDDRKKYLCFLSEELNRRGGRVGSYCLMTNHLHLLIKMENTPLSEIFQTVHMKYARYFNEKRSTTGHVFQGRPGMKIVLDEGYLRQLVGYLHNNPVEAGMVDSVLDYDWSSWRWFVNESENRFVEDCWEYPPGFRKENCGEQFHEVIAEDFDLPDGEKYWGTEDEWSSLDRRKDGREGRKFKERRERKSKEEIVQEVLEGTSVGLEELKSQSQKRDVTSMRRSAMSRMYEEGYGATEIGKFFNRTPGSVIHAYEKWKD